MIYEIYSVANNLASMETTVRFRVWEPVGQLQRLKDECQVTLEGRYDLDATGLDETIESLYQQEILNG